MNKEPNEQALVDFVKKELDASVKQLSPSTLSRLGQARQEAFQPQTHGIPWGWPTWGLATACIMVLALTLWFQNSANFNPALGTEDLELLVSSDSLEFYEELEFYDWLSEYEKASKVDVGRRHWVPIINIDTGQCRGKTLPAQS